MSATGSGSQPAAAGPGSVPGSHQQSPRVRDWLKTGTGAAVGLFWFALLATSLFVVQMRPALVVVEFLAALFGFYASSVAFRKDRAAGVVILIATSFSFMLLNAGLYMTTIWTNPMGR